MHNGFDGEGVAGII